MMQTLGKCVTKNEKVVHENFKKSLYHVEKIVIMQRWKVAGVLHNPKGMRRYANVPYGQVKVVFS